MQERLQKIISRAGIASRRAGEEIILAGRVRVNGKVVTELGAKADLFADKIEVDGKRLMAETQRYIVLHKPRNVVSTLSDPEGRPTVGDILQAAGGRLYPIGRLDFATSGVLLATNDGDFANAMLHPRGGVPKTYVLKVQGLMEEADLDRWSTGVRLDDGPTLPAEVRFLRHEEGKTWLEITLREGRNQQIRRMGDATGFPVMRLARLSFAGVTSEGLRPGEWRPISVDELLEIRKQFGVPKRMPRAGAMAAAPEQGRRPRITREARPAEPRGPNTHARDPRSENPRKRDATARDAQGRDATPRPTRGRDATPRPTRGRDSTPRDAQGQPATARNPRDRASTARDARGRDATSGEPGARPARRAPPARRR